MVQSVSRAVPSASVSLPFEKGLGSARHIRASQMSPDFLLLFLSGPNSLGPELKCREQGLGLVVGNTALRVQFTERTPQTLNPDGVPEPKSNEPLTCF